MRIGLDFDGVIVDHSEHKTPKAPPIKQALEYIRDLGGEPYIVSARRPTAVRFAHEWMDKHGIFDVIPSERVFFCGSSSEKGDYCRRLGINVFLDDKVQVLDVLDADVKKFLFDNYSATSKIGMNHGHQAVAGWREFTQALVKV